MGVFDITTAVPVVEREGGLLEPAEFDITTAMPLSFVEKEAMEKKVETPQASIQDRFIDAIYEQEGLVPFQTPARGSYENTYLGYSIKKGYKKPEGREAFIFLENQEDVKPSIKSQLLRYPGRFLSEDATLREAIYKYDNSNPEGKIKYIKQEIPEIDLDIPITEFFEEGETPTEKQGLAGLLEMPSGRTPYSERPLPPEPTEEQTAFTRGLIRNYGKWHAINPFSPSTTKKWEGEKIQQFAEAVSPRSLSAIEKGTLLAIPFFRWIGAYNILKNAGISLAKEEQYTLDSVLTDRSLTEFPKMKARLVKAGRPLGMLAVETMAAHPLVSSTVGRENIERLKFKVLIAPPEVIAGLTEAGLDIGLLVGISSLSAGISRASAIHRYNRIAKELAAKRTDMPAKAREVLGVGKEISYPNPELTKAWKAKARILHPDKLPHGASDEPFKQVNAAYEYLIGESPTFNLYAGLPVPSTKELMTALKGLKFSPAEISQIAGALKTGAIESIPSAAVKALEVAGILPRLAKEAVKSLELAPEIAKEGVAPTITDPAQIQEIKNSIAEGEMILKSGKTSAGRKMSEEELSAVRKSVENAKAKIEQKLPPHLQKIADKQKGVIIEDVTPEGYGPEPPYIPEGVKPPTKPIPKGLEGLAKEARKYKSAEEFEKAFEYHGGPEEIKGGKLELGMLAGTQDYGGIFTTPDKGYAERFLRTKKVYQAYIGDKKILDLTTPKGMAEVKKQIGKTYEVEDEQIKFTQEDYDFLFPSKKGADWATFSNYNTLFEKMGYDGVRLLETQLGTKTTALLKGGIPVLPEGVTPKDFYNQAVGVKPEVAPRVEKKPITTTTEPKFKAKIRIGAEWRTADNKKMTTEKALGIIKKSLGEERYKVYGTWGEKIVEVEPPKAKKFPEKDTLISVVKKHGGIDPENLRALGYDIQTDIKEYGLISILKKGGGALDSIATELEGEGIINIPADENPSSYLLHLLQSKEGRKIGAETTEEINQQFLEWARKQETKEPKKEVVGYFVIEETKAPLGIKPEALKAKRASLRKAIAPFKLVGKPYVPETEPLATQQQKAQVHTLKKKLKLSDNQYKFLMKQHTGTTSLAGPPAGKPAIKGKYATQKGTTAFIKALKGLKPTGVGLREKIVLPRTTRLGVGYKVSGMKKATIEKYLETAELPFKDIGTLARLKGYDPKLITEEQANTLLKDLQAVKKLPKGKKISYFTEKPVEFKDKRLEKEYKDIKDWESERRAVGFGRGIKKIEAGETFASPLYQSLRIGIIGAHKDVRLIIGDLEVKSGFPLAEDELKLSKSAANAKWAEEEIYKKMLQGIKEEISLADQQKIANYFNAIYERKPIPELAPGLKQLANNIREVLDDWKPFIKKYRFLEWVESKLKGENEGKGYTDIPNVKQSTLDEGYRILEDEGELALDEWLGKQSFGIIDVGYIPRAILGGKAKIIRYKIGAFTRKMTKPREAIIDLSNIPLMSRLRKYLRGVINLKYLEKDIKAFDEKIDIISQGGHLPGDTLGMLTDWIDRLKGYAGKGSAIGNEVARGSRQFFRTITVNPDLWVRNLPQRVVTTPHKIAVLDPRFQNKNLNDISPEDRLFFKKEVSNLEEMRKEYLLFLEENRTKIPGLKEYTALAEQVGGIYPLTDESNRISVFVKTFLHNTHYTEMFLEDKITFADWKNHIGFNLMRSYEQKIFIKLCDKNPKEAMRYLAKWNTDNSQWIYKIPGRSLAEMNPSVRPLYNLFVWGKGLTQRLGSAGFKAAKGRTAHEKWAGIEEIIGFVIASAVAQKLLDFLYGREKRYWQDYDAIGILGWNLGGGVVGSITDLQDSLYQATLAYRAGDDGQKKRAMSNLAKTADRTSKLFLPFLKQLYNFLAAWTDKQYVLPLYELTRKKPIKKAHRNVIQKIQMAFFGKQRKGKTQRKKRRPLFKP